MDPNLNRNSMGSRAGGANFRNNLTTCLIHIWELNNLISSVTSMGFSIMLYYHFIHLFSRKNFTIRHHSPDYSSFLLFNLIVFFFAIISLFNLFGIAFITPYPFISRLSFLLSCIDRMSLFTLLIISFIWYLFLLEYDLIFHCETLI